MIVYDPLWETLKKKGLSTYTLRVKFQISGSTVQRLRRNMSVSTNTLDDLCNLLDCSLSEIAKHVPDEEPMGGTGGISAASEKISGQSFFDTSKAL